MIASYSNCFNVLMFPSLLRMDEFKAVAPGSGCCIDGGTLILSVFTLGVDSFGRTVSTVEIWSLLFSLINGAISFSPNTETSFKSTILSITFSSSRTFPGQLYDLREPITTLEINLHYILCLSTSSPFWLGEPTGFKSYRSIIFEDLPRTGIPENFSSFQSYERYVKTLVDSKTIQEQSKITSDISCL